MEQHDNFWIKKRETISQFTLISLPHAYETICNVKANHLNLPYQFLRKGSTSNFAPNIKQI